MDEEKEERSKGDESVGKRGRYRGEDEIRKSEVS